MDQRLIEELVTQHADRLLAGVDLTAELAAKARPADQPSLEGLLRLARRLPGVLRPLRPDPAFRQGLKQQLVASAREGRGRAIRFPLQLRRGLWVVGLGGTLYLASLSLLSIRAALLGRNVVSGIMSARAARLALPEA